MQNEYNPHIEKGQPFITLSFTEHNHVYGYERQHLKALVNEIVDAITNDKFDFKFKENKLPEIECPIAKKIHEELEQHPQLSVSVLEYINTLKFHLNIK